jgi:hypothetical protein
LSQHLFPFRSGDHDEVVYLTQADALAHGHLTLPLDRAPLFQPTLTGVAHVHAVFPFPTAWAVVIAAARAVGGVRVALAFTAIVAVLAVALFARETLDRDDLARNIAVVAFAASPFVWMLSATFLSYLLTAALTALAAAVMLRAVRTRAASDMALIGLTLGCVVLLRTFDGVLTAIVVMLYALLMLKGSTARLRLLAWTAAGAAGPAAITLALNRAITGHFLRFPLNATGGANTFGFGTRRVDAIGDSVHYGVSDAFFALKQNLWFFPTWLVGSWLLVAAAGVTVWRHRRDARTWLLVALAGVWPAGYFFWWATKLAAPGARDGLGPHYYVPAVAPIVLLAAPTIASALRRSRSVAIASVAVLATATIVFLPGKIRDKLDGRDREALAVDVARAAPRGSIVVLDDSERIGDHHPTLLDPYDLDAPVLYATRTDAASLRVLQERFADRRIYRLAYRDGVWELARLSP